MNPINKGRVLIKIVGDMPLVQHKWSEKAKRMMREKHAGKKTKNRDVRDPDQEAKDATYFTQDGKYGMNAMAIKAAIINAAHKDIGIEKTLVRKSVFLEVDDMDGVLPLVDFSEPKIQEDVVRVGQGSTDLRYRPYFYEWAIEIVFQVDLELIQLEDLITLVDRAGFGVGIGEMRPEKGGEYGRFHVDEESVVLLER